jgi:predicted phosphodiesterase
MTRLVVVSDIHSNLDALEAVIRSFPAYDELLCLGDLVGYGPQPNEAVERIRELHPSIVLAGNHDSAVVSGDTDGFSENAAKAVDWTMKQIREEHRQYLASLKPLAKLERLGTTLALYHGSPRDPLSEYIYPGLSETSARALIRRANAEVVLLGHTHVPMLHTIEGLMLANPGSVGQPRDGDPRASFGVLTIDSHQSRFYVQRVAYDVAPVAKRILESGLPEFLAERLYVGV